MATKTTKKHPGFQGAAARIASREKIPIGNAKAILAAGARHASEGAKAKNPRLKKVLKKK